MSDRISQRASGLLDQSRMAAASEAERAQSDSWKPESEICSGKSNSLLPIRLAWSKIMSQPQVYAFENTDEAWQSTEESQIHKMSILYKDPECKD